MEKSEVKKIAEQIAACEYILQSDEYSEEEKDQAQKAMIALIQLALAVPDVETLLQLDEEVMAILQN